MSLSCRPAIGGGWVWSNSEGEDVRGNLGADNGRVSVQQ